MIVQAATGMTLLGAAPVDRDQIDLALKFAPVLIVADGGAKAALANGHSPKAVIGDFDSLPPDVMAKIPAERLHRICEQDSTDFEKCLRNISAPFIVAIGVTGARLDHTLAAMTALVRFAAKTVIVLGDQDICFLCPAQLKLSLPLGTRFSLYPMGPVRGTSVGLKWPIDEIDFGPTEKIATSNEVSVENVSLTFDRPHMIAILPNEFLETAIFALQENPRA